MISQVILEAATDRSDRLRYEAGPDAAQILATLRATDDATFLHQSRSEMSTDNPTTSLSRRTFIASTAAVGGVVAAGELLPEAEAQAAPQSAGALSRTVSLTVNGRRRRLTVDTRTSLWTCCARTCT